MIAFKRRMQKNSKNPVQGSVSQVRLVSQSKGRNSISRVQMNIIQEPEIKWFIPMKDHGSKLSLKLGCSQLSLIKRFTPLFGKEFHRMSLFWSSFYSRGMGAAQHYVTIFWLLQLWRLCLIDLGMVLVFDHQILLFQKLLKKLLERGYGDAHDT